MSRALDLAEMRGGLPSSSALILFGLDFPPDSVMAMLSPDMDRLRRKAIGGTCASLDRMQAGNALPEFIDALPDELWPKPGCALPLFADVAALREPCDVAVWWGLDRFVDHAMMTWRRDLETGAWDRDGQSAARAASAAARLQAIIGTAIGGVRYARPCGGRPTRTRLARAWRDFDRSWAGFQTFFLLGMFARPTEADAGATDETVTGRQAWRPSLVQTAPASDHPFEHGPAA